MKRELKEISVRELTNGYEDNQEMELLVMVANWTFAHPTNVNLFTKRNREKQ